MRQKNANTRFYIFLGGITSLYGFCLFKARDSPNELIRIGAAGSIALLIYESALYSIDTISSRSKITRGENIPFRTMLN